MTKTYPLERDEILVPTYNGYRLYPIMMLLGMNYSSMAGRRGLGMAQVRFLTDSSPYQHGESVQGIRWNTRQIQILVNDQQKSLIDYWQKRDLYLDLLRPSRSTITKDKLIKPFIYRKWLPGGKLYRGTDMIVTNGLSYVTTPTGHFISNGGLEAGDQITIGGVNYTIAIAANDSELYLASSYAGSTSSNASWRYLSKQVYREITFILGSGLEFDERGSDQILPYGFQEVLRLVCHDPLWRGREQQRIWTLPETYGDLIFDGEGAWFGTSGISGRWEFETTYLSESAEIQYTGHEVARPIITIRGPAHYPRISNEQLGITLSLEYVVSIGEEVVIDIDNLSVTTNQGNNLLPYLRGNLSGFALVPEPAAPDGVNTIVITMGDADTNTYASVKWQNVYIGI